MAAVDEAVLEGKLDTLIVLMAKSLYGSRKINEVVLPLSNMGLSTRQIALVLETTEKNVSNRLGEAKKESKQRVTLG